MLNSNVFYFKRLNVKVYIMMYVCYIVMKHGLPLLTKGHGLWAFGNKGMMKVFGSKKD